MKKTGDILKQKRKELRLTLKEVAEYVGVSEATVSRWESGNIANMGRDKIAKLAKILELSPSVIAGYADVITGNTNISKEQLKIALFKSADISDEKLDEVLRYAQFIKEN